ncbi:MAG: helix-turn-helix transcriptional regulator [Flexistipes sinusarabici]|uniref:Helix-turn-helix transcriptional regulator n=1 Tax=Flexistipes sinusarabici TaxID=2352 RepID=A0A5D0MS62_FLESI|nr:helix-turn-helix transcriptional regulator [Flexistipes sinusarabici]TYB34548.1 MAG: helix-turn-helix transcriptional regulator [Flexistipes sinusarabici]
MSIGKRIKKLRKTMGKNTKTFASFIGISQGSLSDIENDRTHPSCNTLISLSQKTDVCILWLLTGQNNNCICFKNSFSHIDDEFSEILLEITEKYISCDDNQKEKIKEQLKVIL